MFKTNAITESTALDYLKARIAHVVSEIETKVGAHPNYTEAQTKLQEAVALLEHVHKEVKEHIAFTSVGNPSPEQAHAMAEHDKFVKDRSDGTAGQS